MKFHFSSYPSSNPQGAGDCVIRAACDTQSESPVWVARANQIVDMLKELRNDLVPVSIEFTLPKDTDAASHSAAASSPDRPFVLFAEGFLRVEAWRDEQIASSSAPVWTRVFPISLPDQAFGPSTQTQSLVQLGVFDSTGTIKDMALLFDVRKEPLERPMAPSQMTRNSSLRAFAVDSIEMFVDAVTLVRPFELAERMWPVAEEQQDQCVSVCHGKVEFPHTAVTCHMVSREVLRKYPQRTACGLPVCIGHRMTHAIACKSCALQQGLPFAHHFPKLAVEQNSAAAASSAAKTPSVQQQ